MCSFSSWLLRNFSLQMVQLNNFNLGPTIVCFRDEDCFCWCIWLTAAGPYMLEIKSDTVLTLWGPYLILEGPAVSGSSISFSTSERSAKSELFSFGVFWMNFVTLLGQAISGSMVLADSSSSTILLEFSSQTDSFQVINA